MLTIRSSIDEGSVQYNNMTNESVRHLEANYIAAKLGLPSFARKGNSSETANRQ